MTAETDLLPCPFCGAGTTEVRENDRPWLGTRYGEPVSISVRHWCEPVVGQPSRVIERVGRDLASAVAAWNRRAAPEPPAAKSLPGEIEQLRRDAERLAEALRWIASDDTAKGCDDGMQEVEAIKQRAHAALDQEPTT